MDKQMVGYICCSVSASQAGRIMIHTQISSSLPMLVQSLYREVSRSD